ncbi:MAG: CHAT domain-containing protein [Bacteroidia bacterium]
MIWEDIEQIPWVRKQDLILIPDGPLHYLPFELLISDRQLQPFDKYNYLVTRHEVTYVPSATTLFMSRENTREGKRIISLTSLVLLIRYLMVIAVSIIP